MRDLRPACLLLAALLHSSAWSQQTVASESRDTAAYYVSSGNFIVGRLANECLALVGRNESPQQFVSQWQQRNARFVNASAKYMDKRLEEAAAIGGAERREAILHGLRAAVESNGESAVRSWLGNGRKEEACMRAVTLLDTGALDISPKVPTYADLEALVRWAEVAR
jgi:hypothetical protein